ncbi:MAG: DUF1294 domain-containing protein [Oscillospiraceae bacterium]|nr:DUF1294 domain-containing protein [Oscillospiraceae bacterium]
MNFNLISFFAENRPLLKYIAVINIIAFLAYGTDKDKAIKNRRRIRVSTLLTLAFIGGSVGALAGMYIFRHKTKKKCFTIGVPIALILQIALLFCLMNLPLQ